MYGKIYFYLHKILKRFLPTWFKWKKEKEKRKRDLLWNLRELERSLQSLRG